MKIWIYALKAPIRVARIQRRRSAIKLRQKMLQLKAALSQEKAETRAMLSIYRKYTQRQASKEEIEFANKQFIDLLKGLGIGVIAVLPFAPITLPVFIKIGKLVGVDILPSAFSEQKQSANQRKQDYGADNKPG